MAAAERRIWAGLPLSGLTDDSRAVSPGAVFVARRGAEVDGHTFAAEAVVRGAALIVAERPLDVDVPVCLVPDGRRAISALAAAWYGDPSRSLTVAGITGTNGKTTATWMLAAMLGAAGVPTAVVGNLGLVVGGRRRTHLRWTTPPPVELQGVLAQVRREGQRAVVMEVSAQALSQARVADCEFDAAGITNLAREHGEFYPDSAAYRDAKATLFRQLGQQRKRGRAVLNAGLTHLQEFQRAATVPTLLYGDGGEIRATGVRPRGLSTVDLSVRLADGPDGYSVRPARMHLPGAHNVENALCAAALACTLGVPADAIVAGLARLRHVPGRLQTIQRRPFRVVVDYAHNPAGLRALLGLLRPVTKRRLVLVMGARGRRERGKRTLMGAVAAAFCDHLVLTSDRPAGEDPEAGVAPMRAAAADIGVSTEFVADRYVALRGAVQSADPGDALVIVGKGDEPWGPDDTGQAGPLDDVRVCRRLLAERG